MTALKKILLSKKVYRNGLLKLDKRKDSKVGCNCSSSARTEVYKADQPGSRWSEEGSEHPTRRFVTPTRNHQKKNKALLYNSEMATDQEASIVLAISIFRINSARKAKHCYVRWMERITVPKAKR